MVKFLLAVFICSAMIVNNAGFARAAENSLPENNSEKISTDMTAFLSPEHNQTKSPRKRALLIGISKYQRAGKEGEWANLNTDLDLELLQKVLIDKFKFAPEDIVVLKDSKATKEGILSAWRKIVAQTEKGDVVFTHYSGHGDSIPDDNGDEIDGKDESLVPFDYVSKKDYSRNLRDDEIGVILDELKKKQPGSVMVSLDSCYSGTATRGDFAVRGGSDGDDAKPANESPSGLKDKNETYPKEYVFLAAASPRQTAKETSYDQKRMMGVYTLALVKAFTESTPRTTYRDLFERVNDTVTTIRRDQNPQLEGSLDELVLDGTAVRQERFVAVRPLPSGKKEDKAILQTGRLQGATPKSKYSLYDAGTKDPNDKDAVKLADGEIIEADATTSVVKLNIPIDAEKLKTARAFETQHNYEDSMLKVVLQNVGQVKGGDEVLKKFIKNSRGGADDFNLAEFSEAKPGENLRGEAYDIKVYPAGKKEVDDNIVSKDFRGLVLERKDGSTLAAIAENKDLTAEIKTALINENRFLTVKRLKDTEDPNLKIELRVVPADVELNSGGRIKSAKPKGDIPRNAGGQPELKLGDYIMLEIENKSDYGVYVTILNLRSDGKIGSGFPQEQARMDNYIERGQKFLIPFPYVFEITKPLGEESFRAIATVEPTDFTPLIDEDLLKQGTSRGSRGGNAAETPLGKMLIAAQEGKRGASLGATVPPSWATSSFTYLVKEK